MLTFHISFITLFVQHSVLAFFLQVSWPLSRFDFNYLCHNYVHLSILSSTAEFHVYWPHHSSFATSQFIFQHPCLRSESHDGNDAPIETPSLLWAPAVQPLHVLPCFREAPRSSHIGLLLPVLGRYLFVSCSNPCSSEAFVIFCVKINIWNSVILVVGMFFWGVVICIMPQALMLKLICGTSS